MKTKGIKDLYLPKRISIHVKIFLFCALFTPLWGLFINELSIIFLIGTFSMMVADIEIILFISKKIFKIDDKKIREFEDDHSQKTVILVNLLGMLAFIVVSLIVIALVFVLYIIVFHLTKGWGFPDINIIVSETKGTVIVAAIGIFCGTPIMFFNKWKEALRRGYELREQNLVFQNETLKSQVNPHFLFNSLNTLNSLVHTEVERAGQFIGKLSLIYRYILDNSTKVKIPLKNEIDFIRDYFYMHQIRNEGKIILNILIREDEYVYDILPVSLQLLVENAIKHNMATIDKPLKINIYLKDGYIIVDNEIQKMATKIDSTKIGLKNLGERVRIITGQEIIVTESEAEFSVKVPLIS